MANPDNAARHKVSALQLRAFDCWPWLTTISSSGAGSLWVRSAMRGYMVSAHSFGYQMLHGIVEMSAGEWPVVRHTCDNSFCQNPAHWLTGTTADNLSDWLRRRWHAGSPLTDVRGPRGRAVAVREAAREALAAGASAAEIAAAVRAAADAGMPGGQDMLF